MERNFKRRFRGMALAATLAAVGCSSYVTNGFGIIEGAQSDLAKVVLLLFGGKAINDNFDVMEKIALLSAMTKNEEPKALKDKKLDSKNDKDLIDELKNAKIDRAAELSLFELYKIAKKSEDVPTRILNKLQVKILGLMRKERIIDLRIRND